MIISTIVNSAKLPSAALMAITAKQHMPHARVVVCLVEEQWNIPQSLFDSLDEIILARDLSSRIGFGDFDRYLFKFNSLQSASAMKGQLFKFLLEAYPDEAQIVYIDPDMYITGPFTEIEELLAVHDIVITPHHLEPSDEADCSREIGTLKDGTFHGGLIGVRNCLEAHRFADWWLRLIASDYKDQSSGLYMDQRWLNFVPSFFNTGILRHPGYNIAFWNLHEERRFIWRQHDRYFLYYGHDLRCINFSNAMNLLDSCMQDYIPDTNSVIYTLRNEYEAWLNHFGKHAYLSIPWSYDYYHNGEYISMESRERFDTDLKWTLNGNPFMLTNDDFKI